MSDRRFVFIVMILKRLMVIVLIFFSLTHAQKFWNFADTKFTGTFMGDAEYTVVMRPRLPASEHGIYLSTKCG